MEDTNIQNEEVIEQEVELEDDSVLLEDDTTDTELQKKDDIIRQLNARAKKAEALLKSQTLKTPNDDIGGLKKTVTELKYAEAKRQFGYENGLAPDEVDYIFKVNNKPTKDLLEDPFIKGGLDAIRTQKKIANNTPTASSRSPRFELPKDGTPTTDEKQKAFEDYMRAKKGL